MSTTPESPDKQAQATHGAALRAVVVDESYSQSVQFVGIVECAAYGDRFPGFQLRRGLLVPDINLCQRVNNAYVALVEIQVLSLTNPPFDPASSVDLEGNDSFRPAPARWSRSGLSIGGHCTDWHVKEPLDSDDYFNEVDELQDDDPG
ncbi:hypothetical protein D9611_013472 [Ephemerocybe angulata]|uniref:Uncharacterized protein n=1 Tax=Ephemerocybe angulata TaxID=980116 RepID=A0A8H5F9Z5_9AGAR|nr:hypothetical protein D9611_013472 [Tulosesus angulatus]